MSLELLDLLLEPGTLISIILQRNKGEGRRSLPIMKLRLLDMFGWKTQEAIQVTGHEAAEMMHQSCHDSLWCPDGSMGRLRNL